MQGCMTAGTAALPILLDRVAIVLEMNGSGPWQTGGRRPLDHREELMHVIGLTAGHRKQGEASLVERSQPEQRFT